MKIILKTLCAAFALSALSTFSASAAVAISDSLTVTFTPVDIGPEQPVVIASATASESAENDQNTVHFVMNLAGALYPANVSAFNQATALLDANGNISDIFGVYRSGAGTTADPFTYAVAFVSDPDPNQITGDSFPGFGIITTRLPETVDSYDATRYLGLIVGIAEFPYTATFVSDRETNVPDGGITVSLFGLALSGLTFLRRKLS